MIRIGLLGSGFVADFHMQAYSEIEGAKVVVVGSRSGADVFARRWGVPKVCLGEGFIEKVCADPEVDVVDVCLPNFLHAGAAEVCADYHKNIIMEKPLARNLKEAAEILGVVNRAGVLHAYAENQVYVPQILRAAQLIRGGALGRVFHVRAREAHFGPHSEWFWDKELAGGGALLDMGCHSLEVTRKLIGGEPEEVFGYGSTQVHYDRTKAEDESVCLVKYSGGGLGQAENSWSAHGGLDLRYEVYGSEGSLFIDVTRETGLRGFTVADESKVGYVVEKAEVKRGWLYPIWREVELYGYLDELADFVGSFTKDEMPKENFNDGYIVNKIIDACYKSFSSGRWEHL
ncbi:MAG: Gfo/Idh/MocA family oxidoreductase [Thermoprotei archaeon]